MRESVSDSANSLHERSWDVVCRDFPAKHQLVTGLLFLINQYRSCSRDVRFIERLPSHRRWQDAWAYPPLNIPPSIGYKTVNVRIVIFILFLNVSFRYSRNLHGTCHPFQSPQRIYPVLPRNCVFWNETEDPGIVLHGEQGGSMIYKMVAAPLRNPVTHVPSIEMHVMGQRCLQENQVERRRVRGNLA